MSVLIRIATFVVGALTVTAACLAAPAIPHLDLDVAITPETREFRAVAEFTVSKESHIVLYDGLAVTAASENGRPIAFSAAELRDSRREWRLSAVEGTRLHLEYGGALAALDRTLGDRDVLRAMSPMAANAGSFLPAGSGWYPQPAALFSYSVRLSLPGNQRGLVPGRLASEHLPRDQGGQYVATFQFEHPAEGIDLMAGPYVVREQLVPRQNRAPLRLRTYFYPDLDALSTGYLNDIRRYIEMYSAEIGPYPYSDFSVVASPLPTGFGMPTLTYLGATVLKLPFIRSTSLGHEVLHNWWGNGVYVDYARGNWSEGLTTFMSDYFYKERQSAEAAREVRLGWLRDFAAIPAGSHQALSTFRSRTHGAEAAVGYGKSAMVFFMLRDTIGKDAFSRGLRLFWKRYQFKLASWDDLRASFEEAAGRSLKVFFEQWIQRAGGPKVRIVQAQARTEDGKIRLALTIAQTPPAYVLEVPVEIFTGRHSKAFRININRKQETVTLEVDAVPEGVRLDRDQHIWRRLDPEELPPILRQWIIARGPRLAIVTTDANTAQAAQTLARRFFETPPRLVTIGQATSGTEPVLLIGLHDDVDAALATLGLPPRPAVISNLGSAQVWTIRTSRKLPPFAVISANGVQSLTALLRPLPHYGSKSYLAFDGRHVIEQGVWPAATPLIPVTAR